MSSDRSSAQPLGVVSTGVVSSVGLSAPAACAAIRVGLTNPIDTRFMDSDGAWIMSHAVSLEKPWRGRAKLARMAAIAIQECLAEEDAREMERVPILLCVAESDRPGRLDGLDSELIADIRALVGMNFAPESLVIPHGRVGVGVALLQARRLIYQEQSPAVLIVGTDTLLTWPTLRAYDSNQRLLNAKNSNGFIPGEAAACILVSKPTSTCQLAIEGLGFATEPAHIASEQPLRGDALASAFRAAAADAACEVRDLDFRIADISGEQYYFKEAALAVLRTLRHRKEEFDLWHPAECVGEAGSAIGPIMLAVAEHAYRKGYAPGSRALLHAANDGGQRVAIVARCTAG
jgi:3-oxoacyl-[acyl-carrier-protein] synthase I